MSKPSTYLTEYIPNGAVRGPFRGPFGVRSGSVRDPFGLRSESVRGPFAVRTARSTTYLLHNLMRDALGTPVDAQVHVTLAA